MTTPLPALAGGRYELERLLGEGANKAVYAARDSLLERTVALALLKLDRAGEGAVQRIRREARTIARMGAHPHIVTVFDYGEEEGRPYIISELMAGGDVAGLLRRAAGRPLPLHQALAIAGAVCAALGAAHAEGIVHRDIKPGNVWLTGSGTAKLGDFGLALPADSARFSEHIQIEGTAAYLAPEQALSEDITPRTDLYSLGVMLYEMLTGRRPFVADDAVAVIYQHIYSEPVAPALRNPDIPVALDALVMRLLAKRPDERPVDAATVAGALSGIAEAARAGAAVPAAGAPSAINPLDRLAGGVFVGREPEIAALRAALDEAVSGRTSLTFVAAEAGAGKTRLAEEFATYARVRGLPVFWGRCYDEGAPAYWPWVQVLRAWLQQPTAVALLADLGPAADDLRGLAGDPRAAGPAVAEGEHGRFRLFDSVARFMQAATRERPAVLVLDDLHWADPSSLLLLRFLCREMRDARLLIVATYRDDEVQPPHPLAALAPELERMRLARRMALPGLSEAHIGRLIEITTGRPPAPALIARVAHQAEGNALFVTEFVRLLTAGGRSTTESDTGSSLNLPDTVRQVVSRRLAQLSDPCNRLLAVAAVQGRSFDLALLERVAGQPADAALDLLDEAVAARTISEGPRAAGHYTFTHALFREVLYERLSATRRMVLHRRIGEAIEDRYADALDARLSELAYHFLAALPGGDVERAVEYATRAGDRALALAAFEEAGRQYEAALAALSARTAPAPADDSRRCDLMILLGRTCNRADDLAAAGRWYREAAAIARSRRDPERLARAALGYADVEPAPGTLDPEKVRLLEDGLRAMPPGDHPLKARVLARLALELSFGGEAERIAALARTAVAMARRLGDPGPLAYALHADRMVNTWAEPPEQRLPVSAEMVRLAQAAHESELVMTASFWRLSDLLETGDIDAADAQAEVCRALVARLRQPVWQWYDALVRAMRAMLDGRFAEAEIAAGEALSLGQRAHGGTAFQTYGGQLLVIRRDQGRLAELEPVVLAMAAQNPDVTAWRAALAFVHAELGREQAARAEFERLAAGGFAGLRRDVLYLGELSVLAETCAYLGDAARAAELYRLLLPYQGRNLVMANALACMGAASYYLGILSLAMRRYTVAAGHLLDALALHERMRAGPWIARTHAVLAAALLRRGLPGDSGRAAEHRRAAGAIAERLEMRRLAELVREGTAPPARLSEAERGSPTSPPNTLSGAERGSTGC